MSQPSPDLLVRRYGQSRRGAGGGAGRSNRLAVIGSVVVALLVTAVVVWLLVRQTAPVATATVGTSRIVSDSVVEVDLTVVRSDPSIAVRCSVEALDGTLAQVGARDVEIPAGTDGHVTVPVEITTFTHAEQGRAIENSCVAADS